MTKFNARFPAISALLACATAFVLMEVMLRTGPGPAMQWVAALLVLSSAALFAIPYALLYDAPESFPQP